MNGRSMWCLTCDKQVESYDFVNTLREKPRLIVEEHKGFEVVAQSLTVRCHGATFRESYDMRAGQRPSMPTELFAPAPVSL